MEKVIVGPGIVVYKNAIKQEWDLINRLESVLSNENSQYKWRGARVGYFETDTSHRNCQDFIFAPENIVGDDQYSNEMRYIHSLATGAIREALNDYASMYGVNCKYIGAVNMVKYGPGEKFNVHSDDGEHYRCTVSTVGYINDNYEGGELWFDKFDVKIKPEKGDLILSPAAFIYSHASIPVESGVKYAIVTMTDWSEHAHRKDSPIYTTFDPRQESNS